MSAQPSEVRNWQSVRMVLEGLILAALLWTGNNLVTMKVNLATMQGQLTVLSAQLADVPGMKSKLDTVETRVTRTERDIDDLRKRGLL